MHICYINKAVSVRVTLINPRYFQYLDTRWHFFISMMMCERMSIHTHLHTYACVSMSFSISFA